MNTFHGHHRRWVVAIMIVLALTFVLAIGCDDDDNGTGPEDEGATNEISGTVYLPDSLASYVVQICVLEGWLDFGASFTDSTLLEASSWYEGPGPIEGTSAVDLAAGPSERTYTFTLPTADGEYQAVDYVVAFVDKNNDSSIETDDGGAFGGQRIIEQTRLPIKTYEGTSYVIDFWGYMSFGDDVTYLVYLNDENLGLDIVGSSGFDFHFQ